MQSVLTDEDPNIRSRALSLLVLCMNNARDLTQSASVLTRFLCQRLRDPPSVPGALDGILKLISSPLDSETLQLIPETLFAELNIQSFIQTTRYLAFQVFYELVVNHADAISSMGLEFLSGYIQAMDGEKDPRNLLVAFRTVRRIVAMFDISDVAEELFEVTSCYFPITFRPPPNDPYGITSEDLKTELCACMTASPLFAQYAMPLLMEKLTSASDGARRDAMDVLAASVDVYNIFEIMPHVNSIWKCVGDYLSIDELLPSCLELTKSLVRGLSKASVTTATSTGYLDPLSEFVNAILEEATKQFDFKNGETKLGRTYIKLVSGSVASAAPGACEIVINHVVPFLLSRGIQDQPVFEKRLGGELLTTLIQASRQVSLYVDNWMPYRDQVFELFLRMTDDQTSTPSLQVIGLLGLRELILFPELLSEAQLKRVFELALTKVSNNPSQEIMDALVSIFTGSESHAAMVQDWLKKFPMEKHVTFAKSVAKAPFLYELVLTVLTAASEITGDSDEELLDGLSECFVSGDMSTVTSMTKHILTRLVFNFANTTFSVQKRRTALFGLLVRHLDADSQSDLLHELFSASQLNYELLLSALSNTRREIVSKVIEAPVLRSWMEDILTRDDPALSKIVAVVTNKCLSDPALSDTINVSIETFLNAPTGLTVLNSMAWVCKALVLRSDKRGYELLSKILSSLDNDELSLAVTDAFGLVMRESDVITKQGYGVIKPLHKQRVFMQVLPILEKGFHSTESPEAYLSVLSHILHNTSKEIVFSELKPLLPMLFKSLESKDSALKISALDALYLVVLENPAVVSRHITSLLKSLLNLSRRSFESDMKVRIASLKCLGMCTSLPYDVLFPHMKFVVYSLLECLDDPKRLVRKEAAECRSQWFLLDNAQKAK